MLLGMGATVVAAMTTSACSQSSPPQSSPPQPASPPQPPSFRPNQRYPDPAIEILDPSFSKYRIYSSTLEQVATGMRWAEGPAYFPDGGYLLCSDIPNNRIMKFDEKDNSLTVFRSPPTTPTAMRVTARADSSRASTRRRAVSPAPRRTAT